MKHVPLTYGPFRKWPFFETQEIEREASDFLKHHQYLPSEPGEIDVHSLAEVAFGCSLIYSALEDDVLGYVEFGDDHPENIVINERLAELGDVVNERRCRSTVGHECGHAHLHSPYFCELKRSLQNPAAFNDLVRPANEHFNRAYRHHSRARAFIICRSGSIADDAPVKLTGSLYSHLAPYERYAEWQANRFMACILVPARLARMLTAEVLGICDDGFSTPQMTPHERTRLAQEVSRVFNVSRQLAQARIGELFPAIAPGGDLFAQTASRPFRPSAGGRD